MECWALWKSWRQWKTNGSSLIWWGRVGRGPCAERWMLWLSIKLWLFRWLWLCRSTFVMFTLLPNQITPDCVANCCLYMSFRNERFTSDSNAAVYHYLGWNDRFRLLNFRRTWWIWGIFRPDLLPYTHDLRNWESIWLGLLWTCRPYGPVNLHWFLHRNW